MEKHFRKWFEAKTNAPKITSLASKIRIEDKEVETNKTIILSTYPKSNEVLITYPQNLKLKL